MWARSAAAYGDGFGRLTAMASRPLITAAGVGQHTRLLDVATGPGYLAELAAPACDAVVAVDFSLEMVQLAARRTAAARHVVALRGDAQDLPFAAGSFDAVTCAFGVLHLESPAAFFREAHRVLRPGGRLSFSVWLPPEPRSAFSIVNQAISLHGDPEAKLPSSELTPPFFHYGDASNAAAALREAGFDASTVGSVELPLRFALRGADDLFDIFASGTGRTRALLEMQSDQRRGAIRGSMAASMQDYHAADGTGFEVPAVAVVHSAARA